jgi:hypothetical protein
MSRTINRSVARKHYTKFSKLWRDDLRSAGLYGKAGAPKRPTFNQWLSMHMNDTSLTKQSTPADVAQYLQPDVDPWMEVSAPKEEPKEERGVVTMDIVGGGDDIKL